MTTYTVLNFELYDNSRTSISEIALMRVVDGIPQPEQSWLIDSGLSFADVYNQHLKDILPLAPVVMHNSPFVLSVLRAACAAAGIEYPTIDVFCCYKYSRANYTRLHHTFADLRYFYNIEGGTKLNAIHVIAAAMLADGGNKIYDVVKTLPTANPDHIFFEKHICFTGTLATLTRAEALQLVSAIGGFAQNGLTKTTNILVVGEQDLYKVGADGMSGKQEKAAKYLAAGSDIQIIPERAFLEMV